MGMTMAQCQSSLLNAKTVLITLSSTDELELKLHAQRQRCGNPGTSNVGDNIDFMMDGKSSCNKRTTNGTMTRCRWPMHYLKVAKELNSNFHHDDCHCNQSVHSGVRCDQSVRTALKAQCNSSIYRFQANHNCSRNRNRS